MDCIQTIGVVGAGAKGREIAHLALLGGYRVILEDMSESRLAEGTAGISAALAAAVACGEMDAGRAGAVAAKLSTTHSVDEVSRGTDLLIDAAPEDAELQLELFTIFDKFAKPEAILATTSHSISIADLAEMTNCPERCVGLRVHEQAGRADALEILRAPKTDERTVVVCVAFARGLGLEPRVVNEPTDAAAIERETHRL
jgi:3-hydroxybutyryl-CoA dehydrogenase